MATQPQRMPTDPMKLIPPHGTTTTQGVQVISGTAIHTPGVVQYAGQPFGNTSNQLIQTSGFVQHVPYVNLQPYSPYNHCPQTPRMRLWEKLYKAETKTFGAIQILIGLIHLGFGAALFGYFIRFGPSFYVPLSEYSLYPFWGGLFFIISGSLSVSAENQPNSCLVQCSVGFNILSSIMALTGIILYILELVFASTFPVSYYNMTRVVGTSLAILLLLFSLLEFCIAVSAAHFGCKAACCTHEMSVVVVPNTQNVNPAEGSFSPPAFMNVDPSAVGKAEERTQEGNYGK